MIHKTSNKAWQRIKTDLTNPGLQALALGTIIVTGLSVGHAPVTWASTLAKLELAAQHRPERLITMIVMILILTYFMVRLRKASQQIEQEHLEQEVRH